jgi:N-acylglucosamine 2-epimerase
MLSELANRCHSELTGSILPFWMNHSIDRRNGGFWTCLERDGAVFDTRKYVWMNGRQVWMLSRLHRTFDQRAEWLDAARGGAEFLRRHAFDEQERCWFSLTAEGQPAGYQRKPYGAVFVMLGFLEYSKASGDTVYRDLALALFRRIGRYIEEPSLLGRPSLPGAPRLSGLADIYVLCAMALDLLEDDPRNPEYLDVLRACLRQIKLHYHPAHRLFYENAPLDAESAGTPDGRLICPGSIFEINWLLFRALDYVSDEEVGKLLLATLEGALEFGWDREYGGFYYFLDVEGHSPLQLEWAMKLWWVHVEALYALVNAYARTKDPKWLGWLDRVQEWIWAHFPDQQFGEWFGYLDRQGQPALTLKGGNYKGCFHIPRALLFSLQTIQRASAG